MIYTIENRVPKFNGEVWVADNAVVIGSVTLEHESSVWFGCTVRGDVDDIRIGEGTNVQDGSVLHTDVGIKLNIGKGCTIGHMVMLHGCDIGDNTLIGIKSLVMNRARIGSNCIVGACSLVTEGKQFPDGSLIMGSPAKLVRPLTPQEIAMVALSGKHYVQNAKKFKAQLKPA
ncbi:MAG TPA: gamma carbonic anhydrase family protein [Nevskiaceae bacterium]|nr:gamma carbonic anhydrase family protein [Nevskiaceae bacterium]